MTVNEHHEAEGHQREAGPDQRSVDQRDVRRVIQPARPLVRGWFHGSSVMAPEAAAAARWGPPGWCPPGSPRRSRPAAPGIRAALLAPWYAATRRRTRAP